MLAPLYNLFSWILGILYDWIGNYGLVVIVFTVIIRAVLIPLSLKSTRAMVRQQALQPDLMEIRRLYAKDPQKQHQKTSELMKKHNISMAAGCLPSLLSLLIIWPVFAIFRAPLQYIGRVAPDNIKHIADVLLQHKAITEAVHHNALNMDIPLINALRDSAVSLAECVDKGYLHLNQLVNTTFLGMDLGITPPYNPVLWFGDKAHIYLPLLILPVLTIATMMIQMHLTRLTTMVSPTSKEERARERQNPAKSGQTPRDPSAGMNKMMMWGMPLFMLVTIFTLPSAMGVHWVVANLMYILQAWLGYQFYVKPYRQTLAHEAMRYDKRTRSETAMASDGETKQTSFWSRLFKGPTTT